MILSEVVEEVFRENPKAVEDIGGMEVAVHYLVGLVIGKTGGKTVHGIVYMMVREKLKELRRE